MMCVGLVIRVNGGVSAGKLLVSPGLCLSGGKIWMTSGSQGRVIVVVGNVRDMGAGSMKGIRWALWEVFGEVELCWGL
jgi:hypothetical protein